MYHCDVFQCMVNELYSTGREGIHVIHLEFFPLFRCLSTCLFSPCEGFSYGCKAGDLQGTSAPEVHLVWWIICLCSLQYVCLVWTSVPASNAFSVIYFSVCGIALLCWVFIGCLAVNVELAVVVPCRKSAHSAHWLSFHWKCCTFAEILARFKTPVKVARSTEV